MTSLHERDHLPFGCTVVLLFHEPNSFHGFPIDVRASGQNRLARAIELGCEVLCRSPSPCAIHHKVRLVQAPGVAQRSDD
jgi:hypothetical protein